MSTFAVGVDLGGTNGRAALVDVERGAIVGGDFKAPVKDRSLPAVVELVTGLVAQVDPNNQRVGVGIGFAGMLRGWTGVVVNAPNFGWRELDFRGPLRALLGERVELYNDLNAIAYGEATVGAAKGFADVVCVYVGTGVGSGIVANGQLYSGAMHLAGEIGHLKVVPNGRLCGCGAHGCLEAYVSGAHIRARALEELASRDSLATELAGGLQNVHAGHLEEAVHRRDAYATALWDEVANYLGRTLANVVTMLNPARLVMGGGVWQKSAELRRRTLEQMRLFQNPPSMEGFAVVDTTLGDVAGVLGAASLISRR